MPATTVIGTDGKTYIRPDRSKGYMTDEEEEQFGIISDAILDGIVPVVSAMSQERMDARPALHKHITRNVKYIKDKSISLRISEDTLDLVKKKAKKEGIPYQTLIGSWIYKHATE